MLIARRSWLMRSSKASSRLNIARAEELDFFTHSMGSVIHSDTADSLLQERLKKAGEVADSALEVYEEEVDRHVDY
jgi:hypothetical protein